MTVSILALAACKGSGNNGNGDKGDMAGNNNGGGNFTVLSATVTLAAGQGGCANGGVQVNIGLDNGDGGGVARDGTLQDGEIDTNKIVCNSTPGNTTTVTLQTPVGLGDTHCMFGGTRIDYGLDNGEGGGTAGNGTLETGEIDGTTYACLNKPSNLLVVTKTLFAGDPQCQFGGQLVTSGLDDGQPGGTANDGKLADPGEVDSSLPHCNPAPDDVFPSPTGTAGTAKIDVSGGVSPGTGSGSAGGGGGGRIQIAAYGGAVSTSVEAYKAGSVTVDTNVPEPSFTDGAHKLDITDEQVVPVVTAATSGLYVLVNPELPVNSTPWGWPLYDGETLVTSVHVAAGGKLTFRAPTSSSTRVAIPGDLLNEGTITSDWDDEGNIRANTLFLECHNLINKGSIDLRALNDNYSAGHLEIWAVAGSGGQLWNGPTGVIRTDGWNSGEAGASLYAYSNWIGLTASGTFYNGGSIRTVGSSDGTDYNYAAGGSDIIIRTLRGNIVNSGTIDASGAQGEAGSGGIIFLFNGSDGINESENDWSWPTQGDGHPVLNDPKSFGPGGFIGTGTIKSTGGHNSGDSYAGDGGQVLLRMQGGNITATTTFDVSAGGTDVGYLSAGYGGRIFIGDFTWVGIDGSETPVIPDGITLGGSLSATGGSAAEGVALGGNGGEVDVVLDLVLTGWGGDHSGGEEYWPQYAVPPSALLAKSTPSSVRLLGYGGNFHAEGGANGGQYNSAGRGGLVAFTNNVCAWDDDGCAFTHLGPKLVVHDVDLFATGGASSKGYSGSGGNAFFEMTTRYNHLAASIDGEQLLTKGTVDVSEGSGLLTSGAVLPYVGYYCESCDVVVSGDVTGNGGDVSNDGDGPDPGGKSGYIEVTAFSATLSSKLTFNGGTGTDSTGTASNNHRITCYAGTQAGTFTSLGGQLLVTAFLQFTNSGKIEVSAPDATVYPGQLEVDGGTFNNSGTVLARGFSGAICEPGGQVTVDTLAIDNSGTLDVSGGDVTTEAISPESCGGGSIHIYARNGKQTGSLLALGGSATTSGAVGATAAQGGSVDMFMDNAGTIDVTGGDASGGLSNTGGKGGQINFYEAATNTKDAIAKGGAGTQVGGAGGNVSFDAGLNTGCANVSGGAGATPGANGQISPDTTPNSCGG